MGELIQSAFLKLSGNDVVRGIVFAVAMAVVLSLGAIVLQPGFDAFTVDWGSVGHNTVNVMIVSFFTYLLDKLSSDQNGKLLGKI